MKVRSQGNLPLCLFICTGIRWTFEWESSLSIIKWPTFGKQKVHAEKVYRVFSHDVTAAILVFQNNETAAMLVFSNQSFGSWTLFMQTLSFVLINLHRCWPREWKHSILDTHQSLLTSRKSISSSLWGSVGITETVKNARPGQLSYVWGEFNLTLSF